ncbi:TPA: hypothetical protein ACIRHY_001577, partial [Streptococcus suis]
FASFPTSNSHYSDCWSYAGVGVKQSGDRLFQLNNLKRKIVDELFLTSRVLSRSPLVEVIKEKLNDNITKKTQPDERLCLSFLENKG